MPVRVYGGGEPKYPRYSRWVALRDACNAPGAPDDPTLADEVFRLEDESRSTRAATLAGVCAPLEAAAARLRADESPELDVVENASSALRVIMARGSPAKGRVALLKEHCPTLRFVAVVLDGDEPGQGGGGHRCHTARPKSVVTNCPPGGRGSA